MKELLIKLNACTDALDWAGNKTWKEIYNTCHRGDWLLWLFQKTNPNNLRELTLAKGHCANTVVHLMNDKRSVNAVEVAIKFGEGKASKKELDYASHAAAAVDYTAASASATASAYAAYVASSSDSFTSSSPAYTFYAAYSAYTAADYAASAASSSAYAVYAANDCADDYAEKENQQLTADICRKYLPFEIWNINQQKTK